jgi:molecular chaperone GrpE
MEEIEGLIKEVVDLKDLFLRRLLEDKQKTELIRILTETASYAVIEPFLSDIILLLDRLEKADGDFALSVYEELSDILRRRSVERIDVGHDFDPSLHRAVRAEPTANGDGVRVLRVVRNGYRCAGKVIRSAEVVVATSDEAAEEEKGPEIICQ